MRISLETSSNRCSNGKQESGAVWLRNTWELVIGPTERKVKIERKTDYAIFLVVTEFVTRLICFLSDTGSGN